MIRITRELHRRATAAIDETRAWIASHPKSSLVPEYEAHAASLLILLAECQVAPDGGALADLDCVTAFSDRLSQIKQLSKAA